MVRPYTRTSRRDEAEVRLKWAQGYVKALKWINREFVANKICLVADGGFFVSILLAELDKAGLLYSSGIPELFWNQKNHEEH